MYNVCLCCVVFLSRSCSSGVAAANFMQMHSLYWSSNVNQTRMHTPSQRLFFPSSHFICSPQSRMLRYPSNPQTNPTRRTVPEILPKRVGNRNRDPPALLCCAARWTIHKSFAFPHQLKHGTCIGAVQGKRRGGREGIG
jgi:hypothetical protein